MKAYQAVYVHFPFCKQKCVYCDFVSYAQMSRETMEVYTASLCEEVRSRAEEFSVVPSATVYFGGGTPSLLPVELTAQIVETMKARKLWYHPHEATIEVNPGTVDKEKLRAYRQMGFDRISFGVQSLNDAELAAMGRVHRADEAIEVLHWAREVGFRRINADLLYGFPSQSVKSVNRSLELLAAQDIDHISVYGLSVEEGTALAKKLAQGIMQLPSEDETGDMYEFIMEYLPHRGFNRYEISNFACTGQESLHNLTYWHYRPYLGLGAAACTFDGTRRLTNAAAIESYCSGEKPEIEELDTATQLGEFMFMGLRTCEGVSLSEARQRFGIEVLSRYGEGIEKDISDGLLIYDADEQRLVLTDRGKQYGNRVFMLFV